MYDERIFVVLVDIILDEDGFLFVICEELYLCFMVVVLYMFIYFLMIVL